jgi:hypothetical protein
MTKNFKLGSLASAVKAWIRGWSAVLVLLLLSAPQVSAATISVTNAADSGAGSLRAAIASAANGDTINFDLTYPATITLITPLTLGSSVTITGPGASNLSISGALSVGVLIVNTGITVQISGVTITQGASGLGGCILNTGTLTLTNTIVTGCKNFAELGGGILNAGTAATLNLSGSTVTGNFTGSCDSTTILGAGGGIFNYLGAVTLTDSTVSNNITMGGPDAASNGCLGEGSFYGWGGGGGGIFNFDGKIALNKSTVSGNQSSYGGGVYNGGTGTLNLINSTVAGNLAGAGGGGIENDSSFAIVSFSTISGNYAFSNPDLNPVSLNLPSTGSGGGSCCIYVYSDASGGGAISNNDSYLTLNNSILSSSVGGNCFNNSPDPTISLGHNLSDDATCASILTQSSDLNSTSAGLDPGGLKNNGGPTLTVALLATSPAVNAIPLSACTDTSGNPVTTDQRGVPRPQGSGCDIGAFEYFHSLYMVPAVQAFLLIDAVQASTLPQIVQAVLTLPLQAAVNSLNQGNVQAAKGQLDAFVILVDLDGLAKGLSKQEVAAWTSSATAIIQSLGS